jgi:hypothetical protein
MISFFIPPLFLKIKKTKKGADGYEGGMGNLSILDLGLWIAE